MGIEADHIWCSRYLLERFIEQLGVVLTLAPKLIEVANFTITIYATYHPKVGLSECVPRLLCNTKSMGEEGGFEVIKKAILNLSLCHEEHVGTSYGEGNGRRLTGQHETTNIDTFSWVMLRRSIPTATQIRRLPVQLNLGMPELLEINYAGYLGDGRPVSNMKPYVVTSLHAETTII